MRAVHHVLVALVLSAIALSGACDIATGYDDDGGLRRAADCLDMCEVQVAIAVAQNCERAGPHDCQHDCLDSTDVPYECKTLYRELHDCFLAGADASCHCNGEVEFGCGDLCAAERDAFNVCAGVQPVGGYGGTY